MIETQIFKIKRNDTLPALRVSVKSRGYLNEVIPYVLSGMSGASFSMVDSCKNLKVYNQSAVTICSSGGTIQYNWQVGDTDTPGTFYGEFKLYFTGDTNTVLSVPQMGGVHIEIYDGINNY